MICRRPDIICSGLECGHPLPCPFHTVILEGGNVEQPTHKILTRKQYGRLKAIASVQGGQE